jgi:DNA polymerase I-like protein with 3'-5' exonuclease and polymerase domains
VTKEQRALGKLLNYAMLYGAGPWKIVEEAEAVGIRLAVTDAEAFQWQWFQAYPEIKAEQDATRERLHCGDVITSAYGRRWVRAAAQVRSWNQALQAPVASTASDLLLLGLDAVWDRLEACGQVVNLVHDEIDILIPKGSWPDLASEFQQMAAVMAAIDPRFPMRVEVQIGPDWGSVREQLTVGAS